MWKCDEATMIELLGYQLDRAAYFWFVGCITCEKKGFCSHGIDLGIISTRLKLRLRGNIFYKNNYIYRKYNIFFNIVYKKCDKK